MPVPLVASGYCNHRFDHILFSFEPGAFVRTAPRKRALEVDPSLAAGPAAKGVERLVEGVGALFGVAELPGAGWSRRTCKKARATGPNPGCGGGRGQSLELLGPRCGR